MINYDEYIEEARADERFCNDILKTSVDGTADFLNDDDRSCRLLVVATYAGWLCGRFGPAYALSVYNHLVKE